MRIVTLRIDGRSPHPAPRIALTVACVLFAGCIADEFPGAEVLRYVLVYSKPRKAKRDYVVCEVFVGPDGGVIGKQSYMTD